MVSNIVVKTRILLLGDTHGVLDERIAELAGTCDLVVHTGDVGGQAVLDALKPRQRVVAVRGNNDDARHWLDGQPYGDTDALDALPDHVELSLPGGVLAVMHGHQWPAKVRGERLRAAFASARAVVFGHSHRLLLDQDVQPWLLNPGAAGRSRTYGGPSCLVLEIAGADWSVQAHRWRQP